MPGPLKLDPMNIMQMGNKLQRIDSKEEDDEIQDITEDEDDFQAPNETEAMAKTILNANSPSPVKRISQPEAFNAKPTLAPQKATAFALIPKSKMPAPLKSR